MYEVKAKVARPRWWGLIWLATILLIVISVVTAYFVLLSPIERAVGAAALTFICIGIAYHIRVKSSMKVNRALYICLGVTPIGFCLWIIWCISGLAKLITNIVGAMPSLLLSWAVCYGIGAYIGRWIGKRRNYRLPSTPLKQQKVENSA